MTDDKPTATTVRDRLTAPGLSDERIERYMTAGRVRVHSVQITARDAGRRLGAVKLRHRTPAGFEMMPTVQRVA